MRTLLVALCLAAAIWAQERSQALGNLPAQPLGPNDLIAVSVYGSPEFSRTIRVTNDGYIRLPLLKQRIKAENLFPSDLEFAIADALKDEGLLVEPFVTVTVEQYHSRPISVAGAVRMPLVFQAETSTTLLEAIAKAQGLREDAAQEILVSTKQTGPDGKQMTLTRRIPVRSLIDAADPELNLKLTGGEEIRVPEVSKIYVVGNVKKPGAFPVQDSAETTVLQMVALAEGLEPFANKLAYVYRKSDSGPKNEIPIPLEKIMQRKSPDVPLAANDILYIPDNRGKRLTITALERIVQFGSTAGATALIYR